MPGYDFFLGDCLLPVPPEKLQIKLNSANSTLTLINEGEISILKTPGLTDIDFECTIPQTEYPYATYKDGFRGAAYFLGCLESLKTDKNPFQFIVSRTMPDGKVLFSTNMTVSLEDYRITEQAKDGFDLKVKVALKQYREYGTKTVAVRITSSKAKVEKVRPDSTVRTTKYIGIGSDVIVNGRLHRDSYGTGASGEKRNYRGKVNFINLKGTHPYHVTSPDGKWLGWVAADSVKEA